MSKRIHAISRSIHDRLRAVDILPVLKLGKEADTLSGTSDGNGFVIIVSPGKDNPVVSVTVTPYQGAVEQYPDNKFEAGMARIISLFK